MVERTIAIEDKVNRFLIELKKKYKIHASYLYGSYTRGNASKWSDIDVAVISADFSTDLFEERLHLMKLATLIDDRIEPHPFRIEDFVETNPLANEIRKHGIKIV